MIDLNYFDKSFEPICIVDKDGSIAYANHFFSTFFKAPPRIIKSSPKFYELFEDPTNHLLDVFNSVVRNKDTDVSREHCISIGDSIKSKFVIVMKVVPADDLFLVFFNDLTVENELYYKYKVQLEELKDNHDQIVQSDKLSTLGELTASISHEISNPLTIAMEAVDLLQIALKMPDDKDRKDLLASSYEDIDESLKRINDIIANMNTFLHSKEINRSYVRYSDIINSSINLVQSLYAEYQINLKIDGLDDSFIGLVNQARLEQAIINILKNAFDSSLDGASKNEVILTLEKLDDNSIAIHIQDFGKGVDESVKDCLFESFTTTKDIGKGVGMGLSIAHKIIDAHQGSLSFTSDSTKTVFTIVLPSVESASCTINDAYLRGAQADQGKRILVVDNEVEILNVFNSFVKDSGYVFIGATNAKDAFNIIEKINVDLVVTDLIMPVMDGRELTKKLKEFGYGVPVLYMSGEKNIDKFHEDKKSLGVKGVLLKPFKQDEVLSIVNSTLSELEDSF